MLLRNILRKYESVPEAPEDVMKMSMRRGLVYIEYEKTKKASLQQLLPKDVCGVLLLIMNNNKNSNVGHFCLLMKHPRSGITFFDPYGLGLSRILNKTNNERHLEIKLSKVRHHDNRVPYQKKQDDIQTCGRHVVCRYNAASMKAKEYQQLMHLPGLLPDDIVTLMTCGEDLAKAVDSHHKK